MACLSNDIIVEILYRLGVKDLIRYRSISKSLCSSIDDLDFIKLHLSRSLRTNTNLFLFIRSFKRNANFSSDFRHCRFFSVDFDSLETVKELHHPLYESGEGRHTEIVGYCDGLLALFNGEDEVSLWNPSTRRSQMLAVTEIEFPTRGIRGRSLVLGLGHDPISDDYKLIRVVQYDSFDSVVKVYSLKTNSWRRIKDFPFYLTYQRNHGVLSSNALHWVVSKKRGFFSDSFIVAFDLETEEYRVVESPDCLGNSFHMNLRAIGGRLCLIASYWDPSVGNIINPHVVDIWMMNEYGVKGSWTKLISVKPSDSEAIRDFESVWPLAFSKDGDKVLLYIDEKKLVWYDITTKRVDLLRIGGVPSRFVAEMLVESLVPLNDNGAMINEEKKQHRKKKNSKRDDFLSKGFHLVL